MDVGTGRDGEKKGEGIVGEVHEILCSRGTTTDQGDGGIVLGFDIPGTEVPADYATSAVNTLWRVVVRERERDDVAFHAVRMSTRDGRKGLATIRLGALAGDLPAGEIYGRKGSQIVLSLAMTAGEGRQVNLDRGDRLRVLRSCFSHCREPEFLDWLEGEARRRGFPVQRRDAQPRVGADHEPTTEDRTAQYVYLLARIHSREEVVESAAAANAVDEILRAYRSALWQKGR